MNAPCKGCQDRALGCHGCCERYRAFTARNSEVREAKAREQILNGYEIGVMGRMLKGRHQAFVRHKPTLK